MNLEVSLSGINFKNPIFAASGTFGYGYEFAKFYDINKLGSFSIKGTTLEKRFGNKLSRIAEGNSGMLNAIGLQNPGVVDVINHEFVKLREVYSGNVIANVGGSELSDYVETVKQIEKEDIVSIIELNVSCPNVKSGGIQFGTDVASLKELVCAVRAVTKKPLYIKLSPNVTDIVSFAEVCEDNGADGLVLINTLVGMRYDIRKRKPVISNVFAGYSGPAIFTVALKNVYQVYQAVSIPIIGVGGISSASDVIEMMMCGASAVQIGSANLIDPYICSEIIDELPKLLNELNIENITDIIGDAHE